MRLSLPCLVLAALLAACAPLTATRAQTSYSGQDQRADTLFWSQARRDRDFSHLYKIFPADKVAHGPKVHALPAGKPLTPQWDQPDQSLDAYMQRYHVAGVMVLQDGKLRLARYASNFGPDRHWTSFSVAKSVTSVLLGVALKQGHIHSLHDTLATYIPELKDSAYAKVTIRQLLTMTSGVRWNENYGDPDSDVAQMYLAPCVDGEPHILPYLQKLPRQWPAGSHFNYNTAETDLLGVLVQRATHQSLASYLSQTIWKPYGMAADAWWLKDECDGSDTGGSGLSATLADFARFGQFMLDGGRIDGKPVVARAWLRGALHEEDALADHAAGYGYLWWTDSDGSFAAVGIFGQMVYVDPKRRLVIAQVAAWPTAYGKNEVAARRAFVAAVKRAATSHDDTP